MAIQDRIVKLKESIESDNKGMGSDLLPDTQFLVRKFGQLFSENVKGIRQMLDVLVAAGEIISFPLIEEDPELFVERVEAYVVPDLDLIANIRRTYFQELEKLYESQFNRTKLGSQILNELWPRIETFNNNQLAVLLRKCRGLDEAEKKIRSTPERFSPGTARALLMKKIPEAFPGAAPAAAPETPAKPEPINQPHRRAVDDPAYKQFQAGSKPSEEPRSSWDKARKKFTVPFLLRIHFRKYEFATVIKLLKEGKITREQDLKTVLEYIHAMEKNYSIDRRLQSFKNDIHTIKVMTYNRLGALKKKPRIR